LALAAALAAKIPADRIVNFMSLNELRTWVENVRRVQAQRRRARNTTHKHH